MIAQTIALLGLRGSDKVTGFSGVITTASFDLYGCVQLVLSPPMTEGKLEDARWFDINRLLVDKGDRVMPVPAFDARESKPANYEHGPSEKPAARRDGIR